MSHKLQVGEMKAAYLTDKEIWGHFNYIFSSKSKNSTTYKFVLIKSLLENLYNVNDKLELNYSSLYSSFAKIYWNLVIHHNLNQINMTDKRAEVQNILLNIQSKYQLPETVVFDRLSAEIQVEIINKVKKKCKINVMGAIYGDTGCTIYDFDNQKEQLRMNSTVYSFMLRFQRVLNYLTNYHLALFLEKFNEKGDTTNLLLKVENVSRGHPLINFIKCYPLFITGSVFTAERLLRRKMLTWIILSHGVLFRLTSSGI
ncbi:HNH endonuclease [Neobacillus citreus]|uniref:HNH endonuclease n=1 Tax=Neobacillus citreus TaxID=2833578 RepID=A0A9J6N0D5_9BACI|nr:HNH endonuclease [Neobacillus citreus]